MRLGGARGPPGTLGLLGILMARGAGLTGGLLVRNLEDEREDAGVFRTDRSFLLILAFLPNEAKNPCFDDGVEDCSIRSEDGDPLL